MPLRVLFLGTPEFAVPTLERLAETGHQVVSVITQPDRPRGRGHHVEPGALKLAADRLGLPVQQPGPLKDGAFLDALRVLKPDVGVVAAFGRLLPQILIDLPRLGMINVHASLLPRWRGAAPVHRAILAGDRETGVSIMRVVLALDAGPVLGMERTPIGDDETSEALERRLAVIGAGLLVQTVARLSLGPVHGTAQNAAHVTVASKLSRRDSPIDWARPATAIHNQIRGLHPWPLAVTHLAGKRVQVLRSAIGDQSSQRAEPGAVLSITREAIVVATGQAALEVLEVRPDGRSAMSAAAFANGARLAGGDRFTPVPELDS